METKLMETLKREVVLKNLTNAAGGDEKFAMRFRSALVTLVTTNTNLQKCSVQSIMAAAAQAATLKLPLNPSLGYAYIVPYGQQAQFQIGYRGLIQLAQRSGLYKRIKATRVYEGEMRNYDRFTGEYDRGERLSDNVVGYYAYFELLNGFKAEVYMTKAEMENHAAMYSKTYQNDRKYKNQSSVWSTKFDSMAEKTVLRLLLSKFAPLSVDIELALTGDQTVDGEYLDNAEKVVDVETGEVVENETSETTKESSTTTETTLLTIDFD